MSYRNPTQLQLGMSGAISGATYRVVGRSVLGVVDDGEVYYWNEFNLENDAGESGTLVFEQTERGGEWRWFTLFDPDQPLTAAEAATKRVGDSLDFGEGPMRVTVRDKSRVYFIEGKGPEGEDVGDEANYFNLESGQEMVVVSWTGDEVEFYRGATITAAMVAKAFNLPSAGLSNFEPVSISDDSTRYLSGRTAAVLIGLVCFIAGSLFLLPGRVAATPVKIKAPASPLKVGAVGSLNGRHYRIAGHDLVEMAEVGRQFERHEFQLQDDDGNLALLAYGTKPKAKDWMLSTPLEPSESLTPRQAGLVTRGQIVRVGSLTVPVGELFRSTAHRASDSTLTNTANPEITFGFSGHDATAYLLARWDEDHLRFQQGKAVSAKDVRTAFGQATGK